MNNYSMAGAPAVRALRILGAAALVCAAVLAVAGCTPSQQDAVFVSYEGTPASAESYGDATVRLSDGTEVTGPCDVVGLVEGDTVVVRRNESGTWVVLSRRK